MNKPIVTPSTFAEFSAALNGEPGDFDSWLEVNNEAEVRVHINALIERERELIREEAKKKESV